MPEAPEVQIMADAIHTYREFICCGVKQIGEHKLLKDMTPETMNFYINGCFLTKAYRRGKWLLPDVEPFFGWIATGGLARVVGAPIGNTNSSRNQSLSQRQGGARLRMPRRPEEVRPPFLECHEQHGTCCCDKK